jgi:hypothetical protein
VAFSPQVNNADRATAAGRRILVPTFADRGVLRSLVTPRIKPGTSGSVARISDHCGTEAVSMEKVNF